MKVLFDAHAAIQKKTGIGRYSDNLIRVFSRQKGLELSLYTHNPMPKEYEKFTYYKAPLKNGIFRVFYGFFKAITKLNPDVVHISNFAPIIKTRPIVMTVHDVCFKTHPEKYSFKLKFIFWLFFSMSLKKADAIICVSKTVKEELLKLYRINQKKVYVVHEAVDPAFKPLKSKSQVRKKLKEKFQITDKYFLVVGNVEVRKEPFKIVNTFKKLHKKDKSISLIFVGPNFLENKLLAKYKKDIDSGKIKFTGFVNDSDLNLLYNGALSLVYFSSCEGFGLPLLEAMATKTPVIASDIKVFRETAKDTILFVKNQNELLYAMQKIKQNRTLRMKLGDKEYKRAKAFSWQKAARATIKIYKKVVAFNSQK